MAVKKGSDNEFPSVLFAESTTPATPPSGDQRLFVDSADGLLKLVDDAGTVTAVGGASGLTDPMTTRGDIIVRNASNATARLAIGSSGKVLSSDGTDVSWQTPSAGSAPTYVEALSSGDTTISAANTPTNLTGAALALGSGNWMVGASVDLVSAANTYVLVMIRDAVPATKRFATRPTITSGGIGGTGQATVVVAPCKVAGSQTVTLAIQGDGTTLKGLAGAVIWAIQVA